MKSSIFNITHFFVLTLFCILGLSVSAQTIQNADTLKQPTQVYKSPKTASILSAVLPGAGQVYNRKYWKVPIVYAALGTAVYFIDFNSKKYRTFRGEYVARLDDDSLTIPSPEYSDIADAQINDAKDYYKRMLDLSYASLALVYVLNIVDASVDAHLFSFDVSEDLSVNWRPEIKPSLLNPKQQYTGVSLSINF